MVTAAVQHQQGRKDEWSWDPHNPLNDKQKEVFMDWIEQGMDFFGCDENVPNKVFSAAHPLLRIPHEPNKDADLQSLDYAKLHDQLLESLMAEQSRKASEGGIAADFDSSASSFSFSNSSFSSQLMNASANSRNTVNSSFGSSAPDDEGATPVSDVGTITSTEKDRRGHKRPRSLKLHRRVMPAISTEKRHQMMKRQLSSNSSVSSRSTTNTNTVRGTEDSVRVSLSDLNELELPPAASFIHSQCRLQKDKGKGEPAGSNICAKGREHCLAKLEQKMALLTRVAFGEENKNKGTADMKRRPARIAEEFPNFAETRSVIELRMGFMSMQYGILLRWDTSRTGKVTLVVLRKMCHESFYAKCKKNPPQLPHPRRPLAAKKMAQLPTEPSSLVVRNVVDGNHAILQRPGGMEVALLESPYRVDRPDVFRPSLLTVAVQNGSGLRRKSNWTVQLSYDGKTENILLTLDSGQGTFTPKLGDKLKYEIPIDGSLDLPALGVRLYEHRKRKPRKCVGQMNVPLTGLEPQSTSQDPTPNYMKVVCSHDPDACVTLSVMLESEYALWLRNELDARRREEVNGFVWKSSFLVLPDVYNEVVDDENDEEDSLWEWICGAC